jgi:hypothetical protein
MSGVELPDSKRRFICVERRDLKVSPTDACLQRNVVLGGRPFQRSPMRIYLDIPIGDTSRALNLYRGLSVEVKSNFVCAAHYTYWTVAMIMNHLHSKGQTG